MTHISIKSKFIKDTLAHKYTQSAMDVNTFQKGFAIMLRDILRKQNLYSNNGFVKNQLIEN